MEPRTGVGKGRQAVPLPLLRAACRGYSANFVSPVIRWAHPRNVDQEGVPLDQRCPKDERAVGGLWADRSNGKYPINMLEGPDWEAIQAKLNP